MGSCDPILIEKAAEILGTQLPLTFRHFLADFGKGLFEGQEFYGIINDDFLKEDYTNLIWSNLRDREKYKHEHHL